jgi:hypothetical protein
MPQALIDIPIDWITVEVKFYTTEASFIGQAEIEPWRSNSIPDKTTLLCMGLRKMLKFGESGRKMK